jgi:hypothetical protein
MGGQDHREISETMEMTIQRLLRACPRTGVAHVAIVRVTAEMVGNLILARPSLGIGMLGILWSPGGR